MLAHYLEEEGIPTTQISLIREHTEIIKPPRALWVPFELGRPLGIPGNAEFQQRVLKASLKLLEAPEGPLLVDFPEVVPQEESIDDNGVDDWACPISFTAEFKSENGLEGLLSTFKREITELRPWYDIYLKKNDRTAIVEFSPESAGEILSIFANGEDMSVFHLKLPDAVALRLAAQDIKAFYFEAVNARPGQAAIPKSREFNDWFWQKTAGGKILKAVKERCLQDKDESLQQTGAMLLVPLDQV